MLGLALVLVVLRLNYTYDLEAINGVKIRGLLSTYS